MMPIEIPPQGEIVQVGTSTQVTVCFTHLFDPLLPPVWLDRRPPEPIRKERPHILVAPVSVHDPKGLRSRGNAVRRARRRRPKGSKP